eukprot:8232180-Pyramimonas_sp.AAC.1
MLSSLFNRNPSVQESARGLHDHLNAVIPGSHRKCPSENFTTMILKTEWLMLHNDWSRIGSAALGQYAEDSVQDTRIYYNSGLCAPSDVYSNGL